MSQHATSDAGSPTAPTPLDRFLVGWPEDPEALDSVAMRERLAHAQTTIEEAHGGGLRHLPVFWTELARVVPPQTNASAVPAVVGRINAPDLYLAFACRNGDPDAIASFEASCVGCLGPVVARIDASPGFGDDVIQRVRTKLLVSRGGAPPKLAHYAGQGDLKTWVKVVAMREAVDLVRAQRSFVGDDAMRSLQEAATGPEFFMIKQQFEAQFVRAFTASLENLQPDERNLLRLHYVHGLSIDKLGSVCKIHRSSAARRLAKVRGTLLEGTRQRLQQDLGIAPHELDDLMAAIRSRIDLSIERLLKD